MEKVTTGAKIMEVLRSLTIPFITISLVCCVLFLRSCNSEVKTGNTVTTTDTLYVDRIIKIPEILEVIVNTKPVPVKIQVVGKDTLRSYVNTYKDSTGVAEITVTDSVNGSLLNQIVGIKIKEREVRYTEKVITNNSVTKLKPYFVLSAGVKMISGLNGSMGAEVGIKNSKGVSLELGYNSNRTFIIGIKKDIFTFYNKNK
jgi:hypothetical protein